MRWRLLPKDWRRWKNVHSGLEELSNNGSFQELTRGQVEKYVSVQSCDLYVDSIVFYKDAHPTLNVPDRIEVGAERNWRNRNGERRHHAVGISLRGMQFVLVQG